MLWHLQDETTSVIKLFSWHKSDPVSLLGMFVH